MTENRQPGPEVKVLLLAPNWLGDAVMFSALVEFLHQNRVLPDGRKTEIQLAVRSAWAPVFAEDPRLSQVFIVQRDGRHSGLMGGLKLGQDFRQLNPHAIILGPPSLRAGIAGWRSGAAMRVGYGGDGRNILLTHSLATPTRGIFHHSVELVKLGELFLQGLWSPNHHHENAEFYPTLPGCDSIAAALLKPTTPLWVLAPGATYGSAKSWPLSRSMDFVKTAIQKHGKRVVLLGDSAASAFAKGLAEGLDLSLEQKLDGKPGLVDFTGRTDLQKVVSILKSCQVFVGNDSGLMHLAAALEVPTVGVFGSSNPQWTSPMGPRTQVVHPEGFDCRPCYRKSCNQKEFCLDTITAESVMHAVDLLISSHGS